MTAFQHATSAGKLRSLAKITMKSVKRLFTLRARQGQLMFYTNHRVARTLTAPKLTIRIQKYKEHLYHDLLQSTVRFFYAYLSTK